MVDRERAGDLDLLAERPASRDDLLRQLVGGDRGQRDRAEPEPLAPAGAEPSLAAEDRPQRVRRRSRRGRRAAAAPRRAGSFTAAASARRRCTASSRAPPRAARPGSPSRRPRRCRTRRTRSARAPPPPAQLVARVLLEPFVELALVGLARGVREVVVGARRHSSPISSVSDDPPMSWFSIVRCSRRGAARASARTGRCRCSSGLLSARRGEPSLDLVRLDAGQLDDLVPRAAARNDRHGSSAARAEASARSASTASFALPRSAARPRADLPRLAVAAHDPGRPGGARRDAEPQSGRRRATPQG